MLEKHDECKRFSAMLRLSVVPLITAIMGVQLEAAQESPSIPPAVPGTSSVQVEILSDESPFSTTASVSPAGAVAGTWSPSAELEAGDPQLDRSQRLALLPRSDAENGRPDDGPSITS
jgi:hypothetical protein